MVFSSFEFLFVFLPACLACVLVARRALGLRGALLVLLVASIVFYAYWDWRYLALLLPSIGLNYLIGRALAARRSRALLIAGVGINLLLIGIFKYTDFVLSSLSAITPLEPPRVGIVLPLAISFYTFQQIAYLVDCYSSGRSERSASRYALFVSFFPQLIAGPIVHHAELLPQLRREQTGRWNARNFSAGFAWLAIGLFKKVALADTLSPWVGDVFDGGSALTMERAWFGAIAYTLQLYFDFSGYSDMAIGLALFFGVRLPENFRAPYRARSIVEFWRRWHITLSRFLRDYLYIPLGGSRKGPVRRYINLFITMLLGGLWHGSDWTFVIWGGYHGVLLCVNHAWARLGVVLPALLARPLTLLAVVLGWVLFRSADFGVARDVLRAMVDVGASGAPDEAPGRAAWGVVLAFLMITQIAPTTTEFLTRQRRGWVVGIAVGAMFVVAMLFLKDTLLGGARTTEFIYFQF